MLSILRISRTQNNTHNTNQNEKTQETDSISRIVLTWEMNASEKVFAMALLNCGGTFCGPFLHVEDFAPHCLLVICVPLECASNHFELPLVG